MGGAGRDRKLGRVPALAPHPARHAAVRLAAVAAELPPHAVTSAEVEARVAAASPGFAPRAGVLEAVSGVRTRRVAAPGVQCSDLAAAAARRALDAAGLRPRDVGALVFASASQDLLEPATAHIVQAKLGTRAPVMDVKNACNSFLNGLQVGEALVATGACEVALVVTGELPSRGADWRVGGAADFRRRFAGFTMGDAGAAAVLVPSADGRGIFHRRFAAVSGHWALATMPCCGSMHGGALAPLQADGAALKDAFLRHGPPLLRRSLCEAGLTLDAFDRVLVHQATLPYLDEMCAATGLPRDRVEVTVDALGNMASASLPVAFARARARGALADGDRVLWVGLASGIGVGILMCDV